MAGKGREGVRKTVRDSEQCCGDGRWSCGVLRQMFFTGTDAQLDPLRPTITDAAHTIVLVFLHTHTQPLLHICVLALTDTPWCGQVLDKLWDASTMEGKEAIAEELLAREDELRANMYGKFALRNCRVDELKRRRGDWSRSVVSVERTKDMFAEFLDPAGLSLSLFVSSSVSLTGLTLDPAGLSLSLYVSSSQ